MRAAMRCTTRVPVRIAPDTTLWLALAGELNLTNVVNPQLTFWVQGQLWHYSRLPGAGIDRWRT